MQQTLRPLLATMAIMALSGCSSDRGGFSGTTSQAPQAAPRPAPPPTEMGGRWTLAATGGSACGMNFSGGAAPEGSIRPEGGCPGDFYTSRRWTFEQTTLVIRDHNSTPLAQLRMTSPQSFEGQSSAGQPLTLTR